MLAKQKTVAIGALSGIIVMTIMMIVLNSILPNPTDLLTVTDKLVFALKANVFAIFLLFLMIANIGNSRFGSDAINPLAGAETEEQKINGRVANNTLEQYLLFFVGTMALSSIIPADQMKIIPAAVITFIVARIAFWIGYRKHPLYRAPGMAATYYLNLVLLVYVMYRCIFPY